MASQQAHINPEVLVWARQRAGLSIDDLALKMSQKIEKLQDWETGGKLPTLIQAQSLADHLHVPLAYFFLPNKPVQELPLPDFRRVGGHTVERYSTELYDLLIDVLYKQEWYRDYLINEGAEPLEFVGRFSAEGDVFKIADDMRSVLNLKSQDRSSVSDEAAYLRLLTEKAEAVGVVVLRNGIVGHNTKRPLDVNEFRGFAVVDDYAPLVFVNGKDSDSAKIFTLMHELAHIWIGQSGISNYQYSQNTFSGPMGTEALCSLIAAELLMPQNEFLELSSTYKYVDDLVTEAARSFHTSLSNVKLRRLQLKLVRGIEYSPAVHQVDVADSVKVRSTKPFVGGNFYRMLCIRNGGPLTMAVLNSAMNGDLLFRDAANLLSLKSTKTIVKFSRFAMPVEQIT